MSIPISLLDPPLDPAAISPFITDTDNLPQFPASFQGETHRVALQSSVIGMINYESVNQPGHTFIVGDAVHKKNDGTYELAQAAATDEAALGIADAIGIVTVVGTGGDSDKFIVTFTGVVVIGNNPSGRYTTPLTVGAVYYLSASTGGGGTATYPGPNGVLKPLFIALSSTVAFVVDQRASVLKTGLVSFTQGPSDFVVGDAVYFNGSTWAKASTAAISTGSVIGLVVQKSGSNYTVASSGVADLSVGQYSGGLTAGAIYYLSGTTAGTGVTTESGLIVTKPLFIALSTTKALILGASVRASYTSVIGTGPISLKIGAAVKCTGAATYALADNTSITNANAVGLVIKVISSTVYEIAVAGVVNIGNLVSQQYTGNLTAGSIYYLDTSNGAGTTTRPTASAAFIKPLFVALTTNTALISAERPAPNVISGANGYVKVSDTKSTGTEAGGASAGVNLRTLNTTDSNTGGLLVSLSSNLITLAAGTYRVHAMVPFYDSSNRVQAFLIKNSDNSILLQSTSSTISGTSNTVQMWNCIIGIITVPASTPIRIDQYFASGHGTNGLGKAANVAPLGGNEVFTVVEFQLMV
jgi:hypothetical protein